MIYIIPALIITYTLYKIYKADWKRCLAETNLSSILESLPKSKYKIYHDLILPTANGMAQVDHIVLSPYGIFVIGVKNNKGKISGAQSCRYWTETINGHRYKFCNPVQQNQNIIEALKELLQFKDETLYTSIIAFSSNSYLTTSSDHIVTYTGKVRSIIEDYNEVKLGQDMVDILSKKLSLASISKKQMKCSHKEMIIDRSNTRSNNITNRNDLAIPRRYCPLCNGIIHRMQGKHGSFWGCSNYPKCKYHLK